MLEYNGGFLLSRSRSDGSLPADLEPTIRYMNISTIALCFPYINISTIFSISSIIFREQLSKYGMNLDEMCLVNSLECDPNP